jgi:hypothetical protein
MPKKIKDQPILWNETKKQIHIYLTPTAIAILKDKAESIGMSRSEIVERLIRGLLEKS